MVQPTPWEGNKTPRPRIEPEYPRVDVRARLAPLRQHWGDVCAAIGSVITLILLFQPWLAASGPDGRAKANAFGRIDASTAYLTVWSKTGQNQMAHITGIWAVFTSVAIVVTVFAVVINLWTRTDVLARVATYSAIAVAVFVLFTLLYLNSKGAELKAMTARKWDLGGQIGSLINWGFGKGTLPVPGLSKTQYASASLTSSAMIACVISVGSALAIVAQRLRNGPANLFRVPLRLSVSLSKREQPPAGPESG